MASSKSNSSLGLSQDEMKIDLEFFENACNDDKLNLIWDHGEYLWDREYYGRKICLYSLGGFFAEIVYNPVENKIEKVSALRNKDRGIEKYLHLINLRIS
jgi:hypothetical protein